MAPIYSDEMFNSQSESTTLVDMNQGSTATVGSYAAKYAGRLAKITMLWAGEAATSLIEALRIELNCPIWTPNLIKCGLVGAGLRTAPAFPIPPFDWAIDQPVLTDQPISGQIVHNTAATPITSNLRVYGTFVVPVQMNG